MVSPSLSAAPRQRPMVVTVAVGMLLLLALLEVLSLVTGLAVFGDQQELGRRVSETVEDQNLRDTMKLTIVAGAVVGMVFDALLAVAFLALALLDAKGKNPARITTWVLCGLYLCCGVSSTASAGLAPRVSGGSTEAGVPSSSEIARITEEVIPSWYQVTSLAFGISAILLALVAVILLALPGSNAFFRKPANLWEPPLPAEPPYPGAVPYPGTPGSPSAAPYPGTPGSPSAMPSPSEPPLAPQPPVDRPESAQPASDPEQNPPSSGTL